MFELLHKLFSQQLQNNSTAPPAPMTPAPLNPAMSNQGYLTNNSQQAPAPTLNPQNTMDPTKPRF